MSKAAALIVMKTNSLTWTTMSPASEDDRFRILGKDHKSFRMMDIIGVKILHTMQVVFFSVTSILPKMYYLSRSVGQD